MIKRYWPAVLLALCIARLWLMPLGSSFWVDEAETAFIVHFGYHHPSLAIVPQVTNTVYYWLPMAAEKLFGFSEVAFRIPSVLAMGVALFFVYRLAVRLIHPETGWFAVFACLAIRGINYEAGNARPYALGICVASAMLWALVRWMDSRQWVDGFLFVVLGAVLWRVHLIYWPVYLIPLVYVSLRRDVEWRQVGVVFGGLGVMLAPVVVTALDVNRNGGGTHAFAAMPSWRDLFGALKALLPVACAGGSWVIFRNPLPDGRGSEMGGARAGVGLILGWWVLEPLCIFAFSRITGNSVFSPRYLSVGWPGAALTATLAASYFIPAHRWKEMTGALAVGVLIFFGQWSVLWPAHHNSDWRGASLAVNQLGWGEDTPVIVPSPFVEAKPPIWMPDYPLPGFLYCHLTVYPVTGHPYLLPFEDSPEGRGYAETLPLGKRFVIYGDNRNVHFWRDWFAARTQMNSRLLGPFGDVDVAVFEAP